MGALGLAGVWLLVAASGGSQGGSKAGYEAGLRAGTRVRTAVGAEALQGALATDFELLPTLALHLQRGTRQARLAYAPRLTLRQAGQGRPPEVLHAGRLLGAWKPARGLALSAEAQASLGTVDLFTQGDVDSPQPLPRGALRLGSLRGTLGAEVGRLHPRLRVAARAGWLLAGGLDEASRAVLPAQRGPRLRLEARWALSRRAGLGGAASFSDTRFSTGARARVLQFDGTWTHRPGPHTDVALGAGLGLTRAGASADSRLLPGAHASLGQRLPSRTRPLLARLATRLAPFLDPLSGRVYPRAEATLTLSWTASPSLALHGQGGGALAVGGPQRGDSLALGLVGARWRLSSSLRLELDVRAQHVGQSALQASSGFQWAASLGLNAYQSATF